MEIVLPSLQGDFIDLWSKACPNLRAVLESALYSDQLSSSAAMPTDESLEIANGFLKQIMVRMAGPATQRQYGLIWTIIKHMRDKAWPRRSPSQRPTYADERDKITQIKDMCVLLLDEERDASNRWYGLDRTRINTADICTAEQDGRARITKGVPCTRTLFTLWQTLDAQCKRLLVKAPADHFPANVKEATRSRPCRSSGGHLYAKGSKGHARAHAQKHCSGVYRPSWSGQHFKDCVCTVRLNPDGSIVAWSDPSNADLVAAPEVAVSPPQPAIRLCQEHCSHGAGSVGKVYVVTGQGDPIRHVRNHGTKFHRDERSDWSDVTIDTLITDGWVERGTKNHETKAFVPDSAEGEAEGDGGGATAAASARPTAPRRAHATGAHATRRQEALTLVEQLDALVSEDEDDTGEDREGGEWGEIDEGEFYVDLTIPVVRRSTEGRQVGR
jgi:hypothetical protein